MLQKAPYYAIELHKAFRQVDQVFVDLLAKLREGFDVSTSVDALNRLCAITSHPPTNAVWLSPRNQEVDARNQIELVSLAGPSRLYYGKVKGKFKSDHFPSPQSLELRIGAQVMFTKNSAFWVNGTIGEITTMLDERVEVRLHETGSIVDVGTVAWEQFDYKLNPDTHQIERVVVGQYMQIPLMLAWSVTIHKSQGKTIERVHLDLGAGVFETGQTYVALSRCRSLSALTFSRPLSESDVLVDAESREFYRKLRALILTVPPEAMARKMGFSFDNARDNAHVPQLAEDVEMQWAAGKEDVVEVIDFENLLASSVIVAEQIKGSAIPKPLAFSCPSCQRRYPSNMWQRRFTCQDMSCLMTWSPLEPLDPVL
jgi:hypothetical protein